MIYSYIRCITWRSVLYVQTLALLFLLYLSFISFEFIDRFFLFNNHQRIDLKVFFCWLLWRRCAMGNTKAACIGRWWTSTRRGGRWLFSCVRGKIKWWGRRRILSPAMGLGSTQIFRGRSCLSSLRNTTELTLQLSQTSPNGSCRLGPLIFIRRLEEFISFFGANAKLLAWGGVLFG